MMACRCQGPAWRLGRLELQMGRLGYLSGRLGFLSGRLGFLLGRLGFLKKDPCRRRKRRLRTPGRRHTGGG